MPLPANFFSLARRFLLDLKNLVFVFTLGAAIISTVIVAWVIALVSAHHWPNSVAPQQIATLMWLALSAQLVVVLVILSWTAGRIDRLSLKSAAASAEVEFNDDPSPPPQP